MQTTVTQNEKDILIRLRNGDHAAFEFVYLHYRDRLIANLLRLLKSPDLVEEILQDLFLKLWETHDKIDPEQSIQAYLYKVANNLAYDFFRKAARDKKAFAQLQYLREEAVPYIDEYIANKENRAQLDKALDLLPPQQRLVFELIKLEEKSYEEVSQLLQISTGTVNNHLYRANQFLRNYLSNPSGLALLLASALIEAFS